ncbi:diguanylate cyclase [Roseomonas sp. GC11]|uniref:sensor domain-containing diguanylate cyclase n=1 Tax=Roseomonas sp. GC11 TaxID=2950546 RepID=UPI00210AAD3B|nr:diguanylate cyclase [Roseomonas sp. GC11]MCQ4160633.1 diguanylate cyclase [Roseomonas sp. GC11]
MSLGLSPSPAAAAPYARMARTQRLKLLVLVLCALLPSLVGNYWLMRQERENRHDLAARQFVLRAQEVAQQQAVILARATQALESLAETGEEERLCEIVRGWHTGPEGPLRWIALASPEGMLRCASLASLEQFALELEEPSPLPAGEAPARLLPVPEGPLAGLLVLRDLPGPFGGLLVAAIEPAMPEAAPEAMAFLLRDLAETARTLPRAIPLAAPRGAEAGWTIPPLREAMAGHQGQGSLGATAPDGQSWMLAYARMHGTGAAILLMRREGEALEPWLPLRRSQAWMLLALLASLVALAWVWRTLPGGGAAQETPAEWLEAAAATMAQGVALWSAGGTLLASNDRWRRLLGVPAALATPGTGLPALARFLAETSVMPGADRAAMPSPAWRDIRIEHLIALLRAERFMNEPLALPGGRAILLRAHRLRGTTVTTCVDVTETTQAEAALRESEGRFRLIAENSGDVVALCDMDGTRRYVSPAAARVLGYPPEALVGRRVMEFVHPDDRDWVEAAAAALRGGERDASATYRFLRPDGSWLWVDVRARTHGRPGQGAAGYVAVMRDATEAKMAEERLLEALERMEEMATTDALTGLANRRRFEEALAQEWRRCAREGQPLSVLLLDADHFKKFNDRYGHPAGDECLRLVARTLSGVARRPGDVAARHGGEEFALLMPRTDARGAVHLAERVRAGVESAAVPHLGNPPAGIVTVSIGVATVFPEPESGPAVPGRLSARDALLSAADGALYAAKTGGRNRVCMASGEHGPGAG